jgi:flagellar biosynthetic protein FliP
MKKYIKLLVLSLILIMLLFALSVPAVAADETTDSNTSDTSDTSDISGISDLLGNTDTLDIIYMMTLIALIPSILIMTTCFTRIIIVLSILRNALGLQQTPPNQVLIGIALFLSLFIMSPVIDEIKTDAYIPYTNGDIDQQEMLERAMNPLRDFMLKQTKDENLNFFLDMSDSERPAKVDDISITVIIPAFITSELNRAFLMGFLIYLPFLIIDIVVASTLTSIGMVMLPPTMISLPFKLMLFVLVNGWQLTFQTLITGFN